jgi:signal transduction histidine kinase
MNLPLLTAIFAILFFGILAIFFSLKETKMKRLLKEKEKKYQHKLYEATILKEIQDHLDYSLDIEKIVDIVTGNLENLVPYSTASSLILKNDKLIFNTKIKEPVNTTFLKQVKDNCLKSLTVLSNEPVPKLIVEKSSGAPLNESNNSTPSSFFNIPLILNEKTQGIISICSSRPHLYKEEEMTILYKITDLATHALSRLQEITIREKGKLTSLITSLEDGVFMVDINSQITVMNKTAKDLLSPQKDNPTITDILSSLPNSYNFGDKIEKVITLNQKIEEKDIQYGTDKTLLNITITPVLDALAEEESKVIGASFLIRDVTLEKSLSKMKEDFTHIIVHELRSPLTSIKASTEMLTGQNNLTEEDKKHLIDIISNQTIKMLDEVATILDATKLDTGLFTIQKTNGDFKKAIEDTIESFRIVARNKSINLVSHIDPFLPQAQFDNYHLRRVINNLLSNSFKFTQEGGTITVRAWFTPEKICVSVTDTGSGIPKDKQHLLFSKFTQIRSANGTVGTGLGLYIAKGIIEAHGGTISLESEPNKGTAITFNIPADIPLQPSQPLSPNSPANSPSEKPFNPLVN